MRCVQGIATQSLATPPLRRIAKLMREPSRMDNSDVPSSGAENTLLVADAGADLVGHSLAPTLRPTPTSLRLPWLLSLLLVGVTSPSTRSPGSKPISPRLRSPSRSMPASVIRRASTKSTSTRSLRTRSLTRPLRLRRPLGHRRASFHDPERWLAAGVGVLRAHWRRRAGIRHRISLF
jgi:hypothetical protein